MLSPEYLDSMPDSVLETIAAMEDSILAQMAKRITKSGWTSQSQWEKDRLEALGAVESDIVKTVAQYAGTTTNAIQSAMESAGRETIQQDKGYYETAGAWLDSAIDQAAINKIINSGLKKTQQTFKNLTGTLASATAKEFTAAMDSAWLAVSTGTLDAQTAGRRAIQELCAKGIQTVSYPSGHTDRLEVAVRRALITGVNQSALLIQFELADELGCDLVETTAHSGARPSHALWQGKVFSLRGETPGYATLAAGTGYGTGDGLGGWNCRHSFHPYYEGATPAYSDELLKQYNEETCTFNGKSLTDYEASQIQRYYEREIRRWKREYTALDAAGLDTTEASVKLRQCRAKEADFLKQTGRQKDSSRSQVGGFGRSEASRATWTYKKVLQNQLPEGIIQIDERFDMHSDKITKYLLKPGGKHYSEFTNVGYSELYPLQLYKDIAAGYDPAQAVERKVGYDGAEKFSIYMELGVTKKKQFVTVWQIDVGSDKPRFITAYRKD